MLYERLKIAELLCRVGWAVNHKRVERRKSPPTRRPKTRTRPSPPARDGLAWVLARNLLSLTPPDAVHGCGDPPCPDNARNARDLVLEVLTRIEAVLQISLEPLEPSSSWCGRVPSAGPDPGRPGRHPRSQALLPTCRRSMRRLRGAGSNFWAAYCPELALPFRRPP